MRRPSHFFILPKSDSNSGKILGYGGLDNLEFRSAWPRFNFCFSGTRLFQGWIGFGICKLDRPSYFCIVRAGFWVVVLAQAFFQIIRATDVQRGISALENVDEKSFHASGVIRYVALCAVRSRNKKLQGTSHFMRHAQFRESLEELASEPSRLQIQSSLRSILLASSGS